MENNEEAIDYLGAHIQYFSEAAVKQAFWQALASGASDLVSDDSVIKEVFPDATSKIIEQNAPFVRTEKEKIIKFK